MIKRVTNFWPYCLILVVVLLFFYPVFKGYIPFPGDILVGDNPYKTESFLGYNPGSYPNKAQGPDVTKEIYPWRYFSISELKKGEIPFWNPHNFSGNPQIANFQTGFFYPFNLLYLILPFNFSWTLIIMLQPFLAGVFMYLFLKKGIGLKDFPSVVGGISFAFSSYMTVWMEYGNIGNTILWLPLILLFTKSFFLKENIRSFVGIIVSLCFSILAGYIQGVFYIYLVAFFYYLFLNLSNKTLFINYKKHLIYLLSLILPIFITAFQILPTLQLFSQSTRGAYSLLQIEKNLAPVYVFVNLFFPDFFGNPATRNYWIDGTYIERVLYPGVVVVFFALYALFSKIKNKEKTFFIFLSLVSLFIATNLPLIKYFYLIPIPVISTTVATREFSVFIFAIIVLGAMGLDHFLKEGKIYKTLLLVYFGLLAFIWGFVIFFPKINPSYFDNLKIAGHNLIIPSVLIGVIIFSLFLKKIRKEFFILILTVVLIFDLFYFFNKITPFSPKELVYPQTPIISYLQKNSGINRFWGYGSAYIPSNYQSVDNTYSPEGNDPLHVQSYGKLLISSVNGQVPLSLPRPDANIAPGFGTDQLKNNIFRKKVLDLLGVKFILHKIDNPDVWYQTDTNTFPQDKYTLIDKIYPWQIYQNKSVLERYFMAYDFKVINKEAVLTNIYSNDIDLGKTILLEEKPSLAIDKNSKSQIKLISYSANKVEFNVNTTGNGILFLSDNYYPDWQASVDQVTSKIYKADYSFRAVLIPKGEHSVIFSYNPKNYYYGAIISLAGLLLVLLIIVIIKKDNEKK